MHCHKLKKKRASHHFIHMTLPKYHIIPVLHPVTAPLHPCYNVTESAKKHIITPISLIHNTIIFSIGHFCTMESPISLNAYYNIQALPPLITVATGHCLLSSFLILQKQSLFACINAILPDNLSQLSDQDRAVGSCHCIREYLLRPHTLYCLVLLRNGLLCL